MAEFAIHEFQLLIGTEQTRAYAELSGDFNPLHLDPDFAGTTPFGGVIVHGSYMLALVVDQLEQSAGGRSLDRTEVRFVAPVPVGTRISLQLASDNDHDHVCIHVGDGAGHIFLDGKAVYATGHTKNLSEQGSKT